MRGPSWLLRSFGDICGAVGKAGGAGKGGGVVKIGAVHDSFWAVVAHMSGVLVARQHSPTALFAWKNDKWAARGKMLG